MARARRIAESGGNAAQLTRTERAEALIASVRADGIDMARAIAREVAEGWFDTKAESVIDIVAFDLTLPVLSTATAEQARALGRDLADLAIGEAISEIGRIYTRSLPADHRSAHGVYYTPPTLVQRLLDRAEGAGVDWLTARVISPSCGAGAFLVEDAARMVAAMDGAEPAIVVASVGARLRGWDIDPFAVWLSQVAVEAVVLPQVVASGKRLPPITERRDSLMDDWGGHVGAYDLVNDNPAFGKVTKTDAITERFARSQKGHINLYGLFIDVAVHLAKPRGGVIAYLTPTSYLGGNYFAQLRSLLVSEARPASIDLVESRQEVFPDVLQEVALSVFVRGRRSLTASCAVVHVEPTGLRIQDVGPLVVPKDLRGPWIIARDPTSVPLVAAMQKMDARLLDWGWTVKTGPLVPHKNAERMQDAPGPGRVPVIWAESISAIGGRFSIVCGRPGRKAWYAARQGKDSNVSTGAALLLQRTTAKEQHRRLIGAVMSQAAVDAVGGRVAVENHVNMLLPTGPKPQVSLARLAAFFASEAADRAFRCISGSVAVSATELEALPLPKVGDLIKALAAPESEAALLRLYGIQHGETCEATDEEGHGHTEEGPAPGRAAAAASAGRRNQDAA
jgi:adenine-specific DNA-methyltransferase